MTFKYNDISPDAIKGMVMTYVNTEDITIGVGRCMDSTNSRVIRNKATITVVIDGGTGLNKLDAGTEATSTWYAVHVIAGPGQTTAGLLSTSATSPTLPTNYTIFRRVGWVYNHDDDNLQAFTQIGNGRTRTTYHKESTADYARPLNGATQHNDAGVYTNIDVSAFVAPTADVMIMRFVATGGGNDACEWLSQDVDHTIWTRTRQNRSEYFVGDMPCPSTKGFKWRTSSGSAVGQAIVLGWKETL